MLVDAATVYFVHTEVLGSVEIPQITLPLAVTAAAYRYTFQGFPMPVLYTPADLLLLL